MSHVLTYQEPNRLPAGLLALAVHAAFFALLMFGMRWQAQPPEEFSVELWSSLPTVDVSPQQAPAPPVEPAPVAQAEPPQPVKADIELREKNKKAEAKEQQAKRAEAIAKAAAAAKTREEAERRELEAYAAQRAQAEQARIRAEVDAATATQVGRYQDMIRSKIRRNIVMPPDVPENAVAEFKVTLLPGGMVMDVTLLKSSGNPAYDDAAERAIHKAEPLPVPTEAGLQKLFRELRLTIRP